MVTLQKAWHQRSQNEKLNIMRIRTLKNTYSNFVSGIELKQLNVILLL